MINVRKIFSLVFIASASITVAFSQPKNELFMLQQKHPDQSVVFTHVDETININLVNGKLNITMLVDKESMLLDDRAALYSESRVSYSSLIYLAGLSASTLYPENKKYKEIKVNEFKESDKLGGSIFHDDVKEKKFNYPSLVKGAKRKISLNYEIKDPYLLSSFLLPEYYPVEKTALKIVCPNDVEIGYKVFNADSVDIQYSVTKAGNKTIYEWKSSNISKMESEDDGPGHLYYTPHIVYYIKSYTANGKKEKILESLDDLHSYYSKLVSPVNRSDYEPLKKITDSLTAHLLNDEQKIKSIYYWVKDNIKYIAFESGYEGFIPRESKDVFEKRYGDCKDMASILTSMMKYAGIKSYLTWIGSRELPYKYSENPTMGADNHMIASVKLNDRYLFLDATSRNTPFGYPTSFIQGKEAIVHLSDDKYEIAQVPEVAANRSINKDSVVVELTKDLKLSGSGFAEYSGYERNHLIAMLQDNTNEERTATLKNYYRKGNNKFMLESYEEFNAQDRDKPYNIAYKFNVSDYVLQSGDELFVNMNLDKLYEKGSIEKTRKVDLEFDYKRVFSNIVTIKIPDNYEVGYLPGNDSFQNELFSYNIKYSADKNTITLRSDITINCLMLEKKQFTAWNDFVAKLKKNYSESVALKKK